MGSTEQQPTVCLVIPAYNATRTIRDCLNSAITLLEKGEIQRILVVDDGSTDGTPELVEKEYPATVVRAHHEGRPAARNVGWQAVTEDIAWYIDSDCIIEPDALRKLMPFFDNPKVAGVGGSYRLIEGRPLLYRLIHEEIVQRHLAMPDRVNFLGTFNAAFRRTVLEEVGGFDKVFLWAEDADLAYRIIDAGYSLGFCAESRVSHDNYASWYPYLKSQFHNGFWRVILHFRHRNQVQGDAYSGFLDHFQPPLAMLIIASLPLLAIPGPGWLKGIPCLLIAILLLAQTPMTLRLVFRKKSLSFLMYGVMGFARAFTRGLGASWATLKFMSNRRQFAPRK